MIGQIIQSYLVSLGVQIDKPGFQQADATIKQTGATVEKVAGSMGTSFGAMAANFVKASTIISTALAGVTTSVVGLMTAAAKQDMEMQKYASSMMMGRDAAEQMKRATDALGESINDIIINPELMGRFKQLAADGGKMRVGGDFKETMKNFRDLIFEFTRLKQEASYAMTWVGYYLQKYLQRPLADIKEKFRQFNDAFIKNMSVWTEKAARAIVYILNIGKHFLDFLVDVGKALYKMWDSFPKGAKIAIAAITALGVVIKASPLGRMIMLVSTLLLLIDDYYGHMEGKKSAFGEYWDKLNGYIERGKQLWEEIKPVAEEYWDRFVGFLQTAKTWVEGLATRVGEFLDEISQSAELQSFITLLKELGEDVLEGVVKGVKDTYKWLKSLYERMEENGAVASFKELVDKLYRAVKWVVEQVKSLVEFLIRLHDEIVKTEEYQEFTNAIADLAGVFLELLNTIGDLVGEAFKLLFGEMQKKDHVYSFRDAIRAVLKVFSALAGAIKWVLGNMRDLFAYIKNSKVFTEIFEAIGKTIDKAIGKVGKLGRAVLALMNGEGIQKALSILGASDSDSSGDKGSGSPTGLSSDEQKWEPYIQEYSKKHGVDPNLVRAVIKKESSFDPNAVSPAGAIGLAQFMPSTAEAVGIDPHDPVQSIEGAAMHLKALLKTFNGDERLALAAYNAGAGAVQQYGGIPPYAETQEYVKKVLEFRDDYASRAIPRSAASSGYIGYSGPLDKSKWNLWSSTQEYNTPWDSKVTDVSGWHQEVVDFMNDAGDALSKMGIKGTITGAAEKGDYHNAGTYSHANGWKVDISDIEIPYGSEAYNVLAALVDSHGGHMEYEQSKGHYDIVIYPQDAPAPAPSAYGGGSSGGHGASGGWDGGSGFVSDGGAPLWQRWQEAAKNPTVENLVSAMRKGGHAPSYALPSSSGQGGLSGVNIGSIGDIIVKVVGGANATAEDIGDQVREKFPGALRDAAGYFGLNLTTTDLR